MKQKLLNAIVEKRYAERVALIKKHNAFLLANLAHAYVSGLFANKLKTEFFKVRVEERENCSVIFIRFYCCGRPLDCIRSISSDNSEYEERIYDMILEHTNDIIRSYELCFRNSDGTRSILCKPVVLESVGSKNYIRRLVIAENKPRYLKTKPAHHIRNNKTVRGSRVSEGCKGLYWKVRHDETDKFNKKQYREGSGKYDVAKYSRKERGCSEIRAHKRFCYAY